MNVSRSLLNMQRMFTKCLQEIQVFLNLPLGDSFTLCEGDEYSIGDFKRPLLPAPDGDAQRDAELPVA